MAAFTGLSGIAFLATWFASVVHWAWGRDFAWDKIRGGVLTCAGIVILVILAGSLRLTTSSSPTRTVRAAVVSYPREMFKPGEATNIRKGKVSGEERGPLREKMARLQDWFLETTHREARAGAKIVVWPELNLLVFREDEQLFLERARELARTDSIYLLMGMATVTLGAQRPLENKALLINDSGAVICSYAKSHPMPGWEVELETPGTGYVPVVNTAYGRMAIAICFDADFPGFIRQAGEQHADLLLVPANDWEEIKHIHLAMAAFRAVEIGATMIRATSTGLSALVDPYGRMLGVTDHFAPGARVMVAQVPLQSTGTLYDRVGDLFAWLCVTALVLLAGWGVFRRRSTTTNASM
jgi:apolipoprotein N-acyltransferase